MDLLEALGLSRPVADSAVCFEVYQDELSTAAGEWAGDWSLRNHTSLAPTHPQLHRHLSLAFSPLP